MVSPVWATNEYRVSTTLESGRRDVETVFFGTINHDLPEPGVADCPIGTEFDAEFDDRDRSVEIERFALKRPFTLPTCRV